jgi:hypothetical protein
VSAEDEYSAVWRGKVDAKLDKLEEITEDIEKRLRLIERTIYIGMGALAVLNTLGIWKLFTLPGVAK